MYRSRNASFSELVRNRLQGVPGSETAAARAVNRIAKIEVKKMRFKAFVWLLLALGSGTRRREDLMTLPRRAAAGPGVRVPRGSGYEATKEKLPQGRALLLPNVNVTANVNWNIARTSSTTGSASLPQGVINYRSYGAALNLTTADFPATE